MTKEIILKRVNGQPVQVIEEKGQKLVPIKPICDALGIDAKVQRDKIYEDEILNSVGVLSTSTGADGKQYEMLCIPLKYVFGWLFTINPKNVNEQSRSTVLRYKQLCYDVLFEYFSERAEFVSQRKEAIEKAVDEYQEIQNNFRTAKHRLEEAKAKISKERGVSFEDWKREKAQLTINFDN